MFEWLLPKVWRPAEARTRILQGKPPARMRVDGDLNLAGERGVKMLPERLSARSINISRCAGLHALPAGLECWQLIMRQSNVANLPAGLRVLDRIDAEGSRRLRSVGAYQLTELTLRGCIAIERLPEGLHVQRLDLSCCPMWSELPRSVLSSVEQLDVSECPQLTELPDFSRLEGLNISGCRNLTELPVGFRVRSWIDVANTGLTELPYSLRSVRVLWHGVPVSDRVAFGPETITVDEILEETNQELRRVLLERVGLDWFFEHARPTVIDEDQDAGGVRRLLRIEMGRNASGRDEMSRDGAMVCVQVQCPSTGGKYLLRVPPEMLTCHDAIAWTAGFANPRDYRPVVET